MLHVRVLRAALSLDYKLLVNIFVSKKHDNQHFDANVRIWGLADGSVD